MRYKRAKMALLCDGFRVHRLSNGITGVATRSIKRPIALMSYPMKNQRRVSIASANALAPMAKCAAPHRPHVQSYQAEMKRASIASAVPRWQAARMSALSPLMSGIL